jgi:hypothetical protein
LNENYEYDFFVSHASEDKDVAEPLVGKLSQTGAKVWYDRIELTIGDSLREKIDHGLANSRYGVVILSPKFFEKDWPQKELNGLVAREVNGQKVILPVWHNITVDEVRQYSPILADRLATETALGLDKVVEDIMRAAGTGADQAGPMSDVPEIDLPPVAEIEVPATAGKLGLVLGSGSLYELEDEAFDLVSGHGGRHVVRQINSELRALRIALLDNRSVVRLVGSKTSEYLLEDPERRVKETLDRVPAVVEGFMDTEEGEAAVTALLNGLSRIYSSIPPMGNDRVQDPLGVQQHFLYSAFASGAIAIENNLPSATASLMRWENGRDTYWENRSWIRYVATMLARKNIVGKSIINSVKGHEPFGEYLQDTLGGEDDVWNRLCQFDFLQCADNLASGGELEDCFASFSVFRRYRVQSMIEALIDTHDQGIWIPALDAQSLARLIVTLDEYAAQWAGFEYDAWAIDRWSSAKIRMFLTEQGYEVR